MTTLFFISLASVALFLACVPVVVFALMLETCAHRAVRAEASAEKSALPVRARSQAVEPESGVFSSAGTRTIAA